MRSVGFEVLTILFSLTVIDVSASGAVNRFAGSYQGVYLNTSGELAPDAGTLTADVRSSGSISETATDTTGDQSVVEGTGTIGSDGVFQIDADDGASISGTVSENTANHVLMANYVESNGTKGEFILGVVPNDTAMAGNCTGTFMYSNGYSGTATGTITNNGSVLGTATGVDGTGSLAGYVDAFNNMYLAYWDRVPVVAVGTALLNRNSLKATLKESPSDLTLSLSLAVLTPSSPASLEAIAGHAEAELSWTAEPTATSYDVYRGTSSGTEGGVPIATGIKAPSFTNTGLTNNVTYYYEVSALDSGGTSARSNEAAATPRPPAPAPPSDLSAKAGNERVILTWAGSMSATEYNVFRGTTSGGESATPIVQLSATSYTNTGLTNGKTYYYVVRAVNAAGTSKASNQASATPKLAIPVAPANLAAKAGNEQVVLTWNASASATAYGVFRGTSSYAENSTPIGLATTTSFTNADLTNGRTYYYVVKAINSLGTGPRTNQVSATPKLAVAAPPAGLTATAGNERVTLKWTASVSATAYAVYRGTTSMGESPTPIATRVSATAYTNTGLTNGRTYYYVVRAVNSLGTSLNSKQASAEPGQSTALDYSTVVGSSTGLGPNSFKAVGETFTAPTNSLHDFTFSQLYGQTENPGPLSASLTFHIAPCGPNGPSGPDIATGSPFIVGPTYSPPWPSYTYAAPIGGLQVTPGQQYIAYLTFDPSYQGNVGVGVAYLDGQNVLVGKPYPGNGYANETGTSWYLTTDIVIAFAAHFGA